MMSVFWIGYGHHKSHHTCNARFVVRVPGWYVLIFLQIRHMKRFPQCARSQNSDARLPEFGVISNRICQGDI
jgi:hypothetical protein